MIRELQEAKENEHKEAVMLKHISNVQLLCDLFLEGAETSPAAEEQSITEREAKVIFGDSFIKQTERKSEQAVKADGANGDSIFDF